MDAWGYPGRIFQAHANEVKFKSPLPVPHSKEHIHLLADATRHGAKFTATGCGHLTGDDVFKSIEVKVWRQKIKGLEVVKSKRILRRAKVKKGEAALEVAASTNIDVFSQGMKKDRVNALLVSLPTPRRKSFLRPLKIRAQLGRDTLRSTSKISTTEVRVLKVRMMVNFKA